MTTVFYFTEMFRSHLEGSNIKLPADLEHYDRTAYPHYDMFMFLNLGNIVDTDYIRHNADIIASIPEERLTEVTVGDLEKLGYTFTTSRNIV